MVHEPHCGCAVAEVNVLCKVHDFYALDVELEIHCQIRGFLWKKACVRS